MQYLSQDDLMSIVRGFGCLLLLALHDYALRRTGLRGGGSSVCRASLVFVVAVDHDDLTGILVEG